jgi:hypothetical protein
MTSSNKSGKPQAILMLFLFLFIPSALAFDECSEQQPVDKIPCYLTLPWTGSCNAVTVEIYNESNYLSTLTMEQYSPVYCSANFTYSSIGTYNFNYSTGDTWTMEVEEGNKMIYLLYFGLIAIVALMILGLYLQNQALLLLCGLITLIVSVVIFINGFSIYNNLMTQAIASLLFAVGAYFSVMSGLSMIEGD